MCAEIVDAPSYRVLDLEWGLNSIKSRFAKFLHTFTLNTELKPTYVTLIHNSRLVLNVKQFSIHLEERSLSD